MSCLEPRQPINGNRWFGKSEFSIDDWTSIINEAAITLDFSYAILLKALKYPTSSSTRSFRSLA